jgi:hypothetical protein
MGNNFLNSICFAGLAMATANASTIQVRPGEFAKLMEAAGSGDKSWDRRLSEAAGSYVIDAKRGQSTGQPSHRESASPNAKNREPDGSLVSLNKPISLWNSVHDLREPVAAKIAVLNDEPVRLWNAVGNSERLAAVWRESREEAVLASNSLLALAEFERIGFHFAGGNAQGSILKWWEEWSSRNASTGSETDPSDTERCSLLASIHYPSVDIGHAIPDGGSTIWLLATALIGLHLFRRKQALA